ncbi:MAG TPA: response regulator transcription factor [Gaiellaceae bacterium]
MIRVLLAEDHTLVRSALEKLLATADDVEVVGAAANGREAIELAAATRPDVVLMDLSMPELDGVQATRAIVTAGSAAQVVVLTSLAEPERVLAALDAGAVGYLLKDAEPEEVVAGVRAAARGESPLAPKAARAVLTARAAHERADLTERELDVLRCVAGGLPNKLIARELGISEKTVKAHLTRVFQQIGVSDRTQAALWAQRNGLG